MQHLRSTVLGYNAVLEICSHMRTSRGVATYHSSHSAKIHALPISFHQMLTTLPWSPPQTNQDPQCVCLKAWRTDELSQRPVSEPGTKQSYGADNGPLFSQHMFLLQEFKWVNLCIVKVRRCWQETIDKYGRNGYDMKSMYSSNWEQYAYGHSISNYTTEMTDHFEPYPSSDVLAPCISNSKRASILERQQHWKSTALLKFPLVEPNSLSPMLTHTPYLTSATAKTIGCAWTKLHFKQWPTIHSCDPEYRPVLLTLPFATPCQ